MSIFHSDWYTNPILQQRLRLSDRLLGNAPRRCKNARSPEKSSAFYLLHNDLIGELPLGNAPGTCNALIVATRLPSDGRLVKSLFGDVGSEV